MDKYEYKIRADEIKELINAGEFVQAAEIADTIDWRRVKSVMMLCTISDLYKINRRYEDARDMLLLAYERRPGGRTICYSLCELSIKMEEFVQAIEYYKEFVQVAPRDSSRYILQYKLYEAQDVSLEERIAVLEELKKRDYREKWAYELAYLYHRVGLATRCVEECDELILWFGEGKYVIKAMELKMLHEPLTAEQQAKYDSRFGAPVQERTVEEVIADEAQSYAEPQGYEQSQPYAEQQVYAQPQGYEQPSAYAEQQMYGQSQGYEQAQSYTEQQMYAQPQGYEQAQPYTEQQMYEQPQGYEQSQPYTEQQMYAQPQGYEQPQPYAEQQVYAQPVETQVYDPVAQAVSEQQTNTDTEELDIQVKTMDMGAYNTINLQAELAAGLREVLEEEKTASDKQDAITRSIMAPMLDTDTESLDYPEIDEVSEDDLEPTVEEMEGSEVFFEVTAEITAEITGLLQDILDREKEGVPDAAGAAEAAAKEQQAAQEAVVEEPVVTEELVEESKAPSAEQEVVAEEAVVKVTIQEQPASDNTAATVMEQLRQETLLHTEPPKELAGVLSQGADGQLSLVMPEQESIEKQITGQMNIEDILAEWERMKKENQEKREAEVRQHVLQQTGSMFTEFEAAVRDGLLEQLEREKTAQEAVTEEALAEETVVAEPSASVEEPVVAEPSASVEEPVVAEVPASVEEPTVTETPAAVEEPGVEEQSVTLEEAPQAEVTDEPQADVVTEPQSEVITEADEVEELEEIAEAPVQEEAEPEISEPAVEAAEETIEEIEEIEENPQEVLQEVFQAVAQEKLSQEEVVREEAKVRALTKEERELYGPYIQSRSAREQLVRCIDNISLAAYTGNVIITGAEGVDTLTLAKNIIREIQNNDSNFSGKVAKISGSALNNKNVTLTIDKLKNGALIITKASEMNEETVKSLHRCLQQEALGIIIVMEDVKKIMDKFLAANEPLRECFTARMDVEALSNDTLVAFGKQYAREREYAIDDLGVLALHTRIEELQTIDHVVTVVEVREIVDDAIRHVRRKTLGHFFDVLFAKRYDDEDMIILSEKDFV